MVINLVTHLQSHDSHLQLIVTVSAVIIGLAVMLWHKYSISGWLNGGKDAPADSPSDSAIISFYSAGHLLTNAGRTEQNGMKYSAYVTMPTGEATAFVDDIAAILALDLPFNTQSHIVGLSKEHKLDRVAFANFVRANGMEPVVLEGDFPDYFDLYAPHGQQEQVRQVLNPASMQFVVDYCRSHFWEINSSELYIVATSADKADDNIINESQQFVDQIKPALLPGDPGAAAVHHEVPYGEYDGPALACPICTKPMTTSPSWQTCPDGHGILINGRDILRLRAGTLNIPSDPTKATTHGPLACPNCHNPMTEVNYQGSPTQIDSCEHCPFRWLDANEITELGSKRAPAQL